MHQRYSLQTISNLRNRKVYFDANVLIYIFWPLGNNSSLLWERKYSQIFHKLLQFNINCCTDYIAISEFVNRTHRIEYNKYLFENGINPEGLKYKSYRQNSEGETSLNDIFVIIKESILKHFTVIGKTFSKEDLESFLRVEQLDFGDKGILSICIEHDAVLLTNDADYRDTKIDILSANRNLLNT